MKCIDLLILIICSSLPFFQFNSLHVTPMLHTDTLWERAGRRLKGGRADGQYRLAARSWLLLLDETPNPFNLFAASYRGRYHPHPHPLIIPNGLLTFNKEGKDCPFLPMLACSVPSSAACTVTFYRSFVLGRMFTVKQVLFVAWFKCDIATLRRFK